MTKTLLWITDPWATLDHPKDTSLRLVEEAFLLGFPSDWADVTSVRWEGGSTWIEARPFEAIGSGRSAESIRLGEARTAPAHSYLRVIYRTDPPVDLAYLQPLLLLETGLRKHPECELVNRAEVLLGSNEKMEGTQLAGRAPPMIAASRWEPLQAFGRRERRTVLKPFHQAQSKGVELLDWETGPGVARARAAIGEATDGFRRPVVLQRFLPEVSQGEVRLWFLNGTLLASARKIPRAGEFRIDMDHGGTLAPAPLDAAGTLVAEEIGRHLRDRRVRMAAVDLIGGWVTDFNITSPGLLVQFEALLGRNLAKPVIESLVSPWA